METLCADRPGWRRSTTLTLPFLRNAPNDSTIAPLFRSWSLRHHAKQGASATETNYQQNRPDFEQLGLARLQAIFGVRHFISRMSRYLTLYPGDVLWMGTDGKTENMKDGDVVEVEISNIGVLRNPVVREH